MVTLERITSNQRLTLDELFSLSFSDLRILTNGMEINQLLRDSGYTDLGWLNDSKAPAHQVDHSEFTEVFRNDSGSWCISVNQTTRQFYCVDMGD
jgi:hypothetical protein